MSKPTKLAFAAVWLSVSPAVFAEEITETATPVTVTASDHLIFSNAEDPNDNTVPRTSAFMNEAKVGAEYDVYSLGISFSNRYTPDGDQAYNKPFLLEKKTAALKTSDWDVRLGDSYQELGRGLALSLYRDPVFGVDTTLEGASVRYNAGGLDATVFGGRLNAWRAPVAINPLETSLNQNEFRIVGTSVTGQVSPDTKLGGHYLFSANRPLNSPDINRNYHTVGALAAADAIVENVDVYLESNALLTRTFGDVATDVPNGYATYGSVAWSPAPYKAKLEVKDYRQFGYEFRRPPTLEEDIIESINISDVSAARLYGEHRNPETRTTFHSSYLLGRDRLLGGDIHHGVAGVKFIAMEIGFEVKAGYRTMPGKSNLTHGDLKGKIKTFKGQSLELGYRKRYGNLNLDFLPAVNDRNLFDLTYTFSEEWNVGLGYEYIPSFSEEMGRNFYNAGFNYKTGSLISRAFVGRTSGGTMCSGGVCRAVPPYTGALVDATYSF